MPEGFDRLPSLVLLLCRTRGGGIDMANLSSDTAAIAAPAHGDPIVNGGTLRASIVVDFGSFGRSPTRWTPSLFSMTFGSLASATTAHPI